MTLQPERLEQLKKWVELADEDYLAAEHDLQLLDRLKDVVCYHAQQCVEKYLKALLFYRDIEFPRTHDLKRLLNLVPAEYLANLDSRRILPLTRFSVDGRYPGEADPITPFEARDAVAMAGELRSKIRPMLPREVIGEDGI